MNDYSLEFMTKYIKKDNSTNLNIYNLLYDEYKKSLINYNYDINILGVYFFDILKILTHINIKIREINNNLLIKELNESSLTNYPYYSVNDILNGIKI